MKVFGIFTLLLLLTIGLTADEYSLELVKSIGDERENYTFYGISTLAMSGDKDIFVATGGVSIAKYNWDGTFIKKIGKKGQGTGDFSKIKQLTIFKNKLYAYDSGNSRVVELDTDLNILDYIKLPHRFSRFCAPLDEDRFIGDYFPLEKGKGRIAVVNRKGERLLRFFDKIPLGDDFNWNDRMKVMLLANCTSLVMNVSPESDKVLVTHFFTNNPADFYVYTTEGKPLTRLTYKADDKFTFPHHYMTRGKPLPDKYNELEINALFSYQTNYLVFLREVSRLSKEKETRKHFYLVFNQDGKLVQRTELPGDLWFRHLTAGGYLLGLDSAQEDTKVVVYRLK